MMKVLAVNGTYRKNGSTSKLVESALEGAASKGAETEMVLLVEHDLKWCLNCLQCYKDVDSTPLGPCCLEDDIDQLVEKLDQADGVIFATPLHCGMPTGIMMAFIERITFRLCRPGGEVCGLKACPTPRRTDKVRAVASIVNAGGIPGSLRRMCDATPYLKETLTMGLNGHWIGDTYADARLTKQPETDADWNNIFGLRKLTGAQLKEARELGAKMAEALEGPALKPSPLIDPIGNVMGRAYLALAGSYKTVGDDAAE